MMPDVLVIGAGPAGLAAARAAAEAGARVLVIDQADSPGGHLAARVDTLAAPPALDGLRADLAARALAQAATDAGAEIQTGTLCWALFEDCAATLRNGKVAAIEAAATVVATGSLPLPHPFRGWTLPGVMTAPAVERVINQISFLPGQQAVVVGDTPEAWRVAWLLELCGAAVQRCDEIDEAVGGEKVEQVTIAGRTYPADLVVLATGRMPQVELLNARGCPLTPEGAPAVSETQATPIAGLLVAGSACGAATLPHSLLTGAIAGITAAEQAGRVSADAAERRRTELRAELGELRRLAAPPIALLPSDEFALVCRCEEVPRTEIADAIAAGARTVDDVKRMTRCGMGFCQGKGCTFTAMRLLAQAGAAPAPLPLRLRPPVRPVRLGDLAAGGRDISLLERAIHQEGSEPHS